MNRLREVIRYKYLYFMLLPTLLFFFIFSYIPMYGTILAFKTFNFQKGILLSPWADPLLKNFYRIFRDPTFLKVLYQTLSISVGRLVFEFPFAILLALLLNELRKDKLKRIYQTAFTFPHFLSWVVVYGILFNLFSDAGFVNQVIVFVGGDKVSPLLDPKAFRALIYMTSIWKEAGWGCIIYLAAIAGINPELYEAMRVDGGNRFTQVRYITLPCISATIGILFILQVGSALNAGFDQIFNMYNAAVKDYNHILDTYVYEQTFQKGLNFSISTAIGLFKSVVSTLLLLAANYGVRKTTGESVF